MTDNTQTWYYEDFCHDLSEYLKKHEGLFIKTAYDGWNPRVDTDALSVVLSNFWYDK